MLKKYLILVKYTPILVSIISSLVIFIFIHIQPFHPLNRDIVTQNYVLDGKKTVDGQIAYEGDSWNSEAASIPLSQEASIIYKVDKNEDIRGLYIQGDHDDSFNIEKSENCRDFTAIWSVKKVREQGLRSRKKIFARPFKTSCLKVSVVPSDGLTSISEFRIITQRDYQRKKTIQCSYRTADNVLKTRIYFLIFFIIFFLYFFKHDAPLLYNALLFLAPATSLLSVILIIPDAFPFDQDTLSFIRMSSALIVLLIIVKVFYHLKKTKDQIPATALISIFALISFFSFIEYGHPQFYDSKNDRAEFVHNVDMMVYFPLAKYANELGFNGIYNAHTAAIIENYDDITIDALNNQYIRDLKDNKIKSVSDLKDDILSVHKRFSDKRWQSFKRDSRYFTDSLGLEMAFRNMRDHGGNATPVWLMFARGIFLNNKASHSLLFTGAMIDYILLALMFIAIGWAFGIPAAFITMTVFGATDFYMGGTNWAGATLRHDWMAALGIGIAALKKDHFIAGGIFFMIATLIRAFPGVVFVAIGISFIIWLSFETISQKKFPPLKYIWKNQKHIFLTAIGAIACMVTLVLLSMAVYSFDIWVLWFKKVMLLNSESHVNNISLKSLFTFSTNGTLQYIQTRLTGEDWQHLQKTTFYSRHFLYLISQILLTAAVMFTTYKQHIYKTAIMGLSFIFIWMDPANYYQHILFLFPLLGFELYTKSKYRLIYPKTFKDAVLVIAPLFLCVLQYSTTNRSYLDYHYLDESALLLTFYLVIITIQSGNIFKIKE